MSACSTSAATLRERWRRASRSRCNSIRRRFGWRWGSPAVSAELAKNFRDADALGVEATPGLVTARTLVQGALDFQQLQALVNPV